MQSRRASFIEALMNIGTGFFISLLVWTYIVAPLFNLPNSTGTNLAITSIFTVTSIIRSYIWRRVFNAITLHYHNKKLQEETDEAPHRHSRQGASG